MSENVRELTPEQQQALDLLMSGTKLSDIASALNIAPRTLYRWRQLPAFAELHRELQQRRQEEIRERFTEVMRLAFVALERELKKAEDPSWRNPIDTALDVIKLMHCVPMLAMPVTAPATPALAEQAEG
jgi:hypothetical protein